MAKTKVVKNRRLEAEYQFKEVGKGIIESYRVKGSRLFDAFVYLPGGEPNFSSFGRVYGGAKSFEIAVAAMEGFINSTKHHNRELRLYFEDLGNLTEAGWSDRYRISNPQQSTIKKTKK